MKSENSLPKLCDLLSITPLYSMYPLSHLDTDEIKSFIESVMRPEQPIDCFCTGCGCQSTFNAFLVRPNVVLKEQEECIDNVIFGVELRCARNNEHRIHIFFRFVDNTLIKIGQYPSIADLSISETSQYKKILGNEKYKELNMAIGLESHGVGIGSFVYLRRIFEYLIEQAYLDGKSLDTWDENEYQKSKMDGKIHLLRNHLPTLLVENRKIYSILSTGIHQLGEEECKKYFDVILQGIEIILDEKLEEQRKKEKIARVKEAVSIISKELK